MSTKYGEVGKKQAKLKDTGSVGKKHGTVGKQEFVPRDADGEPLFDDRGPQVQVPYGQALEAYDAAVDQTEKKLKDADDEFFKKVTERRDAKAASEAKDLAEANERGLNESINSQRAALKAESEWDFFSVVVFQSEDQRRAFLEAIRWNWRERGGIYIDGQDLAKQLGITLPPGPTWKTGEPKDIWAEFAFDEYFFAF